MQTPEELRDPLAAAAAACVEPYLEAWAELGGGEDHPVVDVLEKVSARHRESVATAGLEGDTPEDPADRADRMLAYRHSIDTEVLQPLSDVLGHRGPTNLVESALRQASERASELCHDLPEQVVVPWPDDALERKASDTLARRAGKAVARIVSSARKAGQDRSLPLRSVAVRHLAKVVAPGEDATGADALRAWAEWSRRLELLWAQWGRAALPILSRAELPDEEEESEEDIDVWVSLREAARGLQSGLDALVEGNPGPELATEAEARLGRAREALAADLAVAGSFLLRLDGPVGATSPGRMSRTARALREWDPSVAARLRLHLSLLSIMSGGSAVLQRTAFRFRDRCISGATALPEIASRFEELAGELTGSEDAEALKEHIRKMDSAVEDALAPVGQVMPDEGTLASALREISDSGVEALQAMIRQMPTTLVLHSLGAKVPTGANPPETRTLPLQELARQSFDALRMERIRSATAGLATPLEEVRAQLSELRGVYEFARDEATRELESEEADATDRARDLISGSLTSTAEALRTQLKALEKAASDARNRLASEISEGSNALLDRVGAGRMEARLFAARSRFADVRASIADRWGPPVRRASRRVLAGLRRLRRYTDRFVRRGSAMVGAAPAVTAESTRTLRALTDWHAATEGLPLVYQRLFTLEPVSDPAILAGREAQLQEAMRSWRRWRDADGVPLVVRGRQGSGITSFLNVLEAQIEGDGGSVVRSALEERITEESSLAALLAGLLELPSVDSLDGLASAIFAAPKDSLPAAVALDDLEHLYLRVPRGTDLIERLLTLMAETEPRVFWIGGITSSAWQLVATAEPNAISQVDVFDLPPLSAKTMREAITLRHRRSGLSIHYEEPTAGGHLLRRRLRRMRDPEKYERLLADHFFDRLHKASGGHLGLALHQWLVAADFTSGEGVVMRPPEQPDFSILDALDLTQNFTLKAFLEHRSLTLGEHDRIFRLPRHESYQIFEALRNRHLLEPVARGNGSTDDRSEIEEELRYRVRPLLTGTVISHLRARNIVH